MKQIKKFYNGCISSKYYINDKGERHGLYIGYWGDGKLRYKINWVNGKEYGLITVYHHIESGKIVEQDYYL